MFDFQKESRFNGTLSKLKRSKQLLADDSVEVALMKELLHCHADVEQTDELVSFCLQFIGCCLMDISTAKCAVEGHSVPCLTVN